VVNVLKKIPKRKIFREKGRSICVISAVFFTTVLFVTVFSALFAIVDAGEEMLRKSSPIATDMALFLTEEEYERVSKNDLISQSSTGIWIGYMESPAGNEKINLYSFQEKMARWLRYYPTEGRMPQKADEIVVSDQYLRERNITYRENEPIDITYSIDEKEYTDTFTIVGTYPRSMQPLYVAIVSEDFYKETCRELKQQGTDPEREVYLMAGIMFKSNGNVRRLASMLIEQEGLDLEDGQVFLNDISLLGSMGVGVWMAVFGLVIAVMAVGYLFISNIYCISIASDARFYGKLTTNGVTKKEIKKLIHRENNILFLISAVPALFVGYAFSSAALPKILNMYTTFEVKGSLNFRIFILSLAFSYLTVRISVHKPVKLAKNCSPIEMRKYMGKLGQVKKSDNGDCLKKFVIRHLKSDKKKVLKVCVSIALSVFIANAFYAIAEGFDEGEYVKEDLDADYIMAKKSILTNLSVNTVSYERTTPDEIAEYKGLPGIKEEGGGSMSHVCIRPSQAVWDNFAKIVGEVHYETPGEMYVGAYGLDDIMLKRMKIIEGEIDLDLFHTGKYVLLDPILSDNNVENEACYKPGDTVTIPFRSGEEGVYTVMAVVESLPVSLSFPGRYQGSNLYLPMKEWQEKEKRKDYYIYAFDVEEEFHGMWDETLDSSAEVKGGLLSYKSAKTIADEVKEYTNGLKLLGIVLCAILLSMGIMNFVNCTVGNIYNRRKEFAVFQSMGMEEKEIKMSLVKEGILYMAGGFIFGIVLSIPGIYILIENILREPYIKYHFYLMPFVLFLLLGNLIAVLTPWISYKKMEKRENFLERVCLCRE